MKKLPLLFLLISISITHSYAQYHTNQNKVWTFGNKAGLDFNSGAPVPIVTGVNSMYPSECGASVCDTDGHLLFYTDGKNVYNKNHVLMPTGVNIVPYVTFSATQAALIAPVIANPGRYYVFSLEQMGAAGPLLCRLSYCIVDMSLDGGYGDVIASSKETAVEDSLSEKMIAIAGDNNNIWVVTHLKDTAVFLAYEITATGLNTTPVISNTGTMSGTNCYTYGVLKASPNGKKIVSQSYNPSPVFARGTEMYEFDAATGVVSGCTVLANGISQYGAEFSADNTKLYVQEVPNIDTVAIYQYDITASSTSAIIATKTKIMTRGYSSVTDMRLGPDGKIYLRGTGGTTSYFSPYLDRIDMPNMAGSACGYTADAIHLPTGSTMHLGLPNVYVVPKSGATLAIETIGAPEISIFPDPAADKLFISSTKKIEQVRILDMTGRELHSATIGSKAATIDISMLPSGLYLASIDGITMQRFAKQ